MKVFLACAFGAFIGALVSLKIRHNFWWAGMIGGGIIGYFSYDFKKSIQAFKAAGKAVSGEPFWNGVKIFCTGFSVALAIISILSPFIYLLRYCEKGAMELAILAALLVLIIFPIFALKERSENCPAHRERPEQYGIDCCRRHVRDDVKNGLSLALKRNIFTVYLYHIPRFILLFIFHFLKFVHSDIRLLCGLDAAIGAAIGYYVGNPIIGAFAGGVFGVLNYEIVSKRIWKVAT